MSFSAYLFFNGYSFLDTYKLNIQIKNSQTNLNTNIETEKIDKIHLSSKDDNISKLNLLEEINELEKNEIIIGNEIVITVKANDTFSKIISPYFQNKTIINNIINEVNKKYGEGELNPETGIFTPNKS